MTCNCDNDGSNEYIIELGEFGLPGAKGDRGEQGYSPVVSYTTNSDTIQFTLVNENSTLTTPNYYDYLAKKDLSNSPIYTILSDYPTNSQVANTYLTQANASNTYFTKADALNKLNTNGNNASNPITINNLSIQSIGTGTRIGSSGGVLTLQGSGVRPAYLQTGSTSKTLALYADLPTRTSQLTNDSNFLTASDITTKMDTDGSNADNTVSLNNLELSGGLEGTGHGFNIQNNNGNISIIADDSIYLITNGTNSKVFCDTKEVATVDQIPTVNNATITLTQGGVTKGSFTLNQSGSATIALDSGGSTIGNQISLITEDGTKSLTLGVDNTTKKIIATYNTLSEGAVSSSVPINLIKSTTAPITVSASSVDGLCDIGLDYDTNSLDVDANNKLTVDSDYIEAHKAYLTDGDTLTLTDPQGLEYVKYYNQSTFDLSKFTVVRTPTITDDGIASGLGNNNYLNTNIVIGQKPFKIKAKVDYLNTISGQRIFQIGLGAKLTFSVYTQIYGSNPTQLRMSGTLSDDTTFADGIADISGDIIAELEFTGSEYILKAYNVAGTLLGSKTVTSNLYIKNVDTLDLLIGTNATDITYDLKQLSITIDGQEVFSGNKTGVDTYTIGSDTITIPYKVSKTGSKIVDSAYRIEVTSVYKDQGYAPYYTLDETNGNFTLPMGEIYGYITRLEGIVKDLQTRLTALESNIDAGGAGVVQQSLLDMSPLSLNRPQLLGMFNSEDEINTMNIEPIEEEIAPVTISEDELKGEIPQEEIEPQETEEETEEGGEDE